LTYLDHTHEGTGFRRGTGSFCYEGKEQKPKENEKIADIETPSAKGFEGGI